MPYCRYCGRQVRAGEQYCSGCGAPLDENGDAIQPSSRPPAPRSRPAPALAPDLFEEEEIAPVRPLGRPARPWGMIIGIVLVIFVIAAGAFVFLSGSLQQPAAKNETAPPATVKASGISPVNGACTDGLTLCSGGCVDLKTDLGNCGACGFSVPYGMICQDGQFIDPSATATIPPTLTLPPSPSLTASSTPTPTKGPCPDGQNLCSGKCKNLLTDNANCGKCGWDCPKGQICQSGQCLPPDLTPVVTGTIRANVTQALSCSGGEITCGGSCVNVFTDEKNCGVCGRACGSQDACVNARCGPACTESGTTLCGDTCIDLDTDKENCGSCGKSCPSGLPNAMGSRCTSGECIVSQCSLNYGDCNEKVADGCEADLRFDDNNCGSCGVKCPEGQICSLKQCK
jgi:hypothetical protein